MPIKRFSRAFTLLEVLVSGGILFIVASAVVGLSNSIIQGTSISNDTTITNRWAAEGLELTTKIRDDAVKQASFETGQVIWFAPAENVGKYGWYYLKDTSLAADGTQWALTKIADTNNIIDLTKLSATLSPDELKATNLTSDTLLANRLVCVEAVAAQKLTDETKLGCNVTENGTQTLSDGDRTIRTNCDRGSLTANPRNEDLFCKLTLESLNRNKTGSGTTTIPDGNAVKVRSVVIWPDRGKNLTTDIATLLTNWKSVEQL